MLALLAESREEEYFVASRSLREAPHRFLIRVLTHANVSPECPRAGDLVT